MNQTGYGSFAGAALSGKQHRDVDCGEFANLVMKRMHGWHGAKNHVSRRQRWFSETGLGAQGGLSASLKRMWSSHCPVHSAHRMPTQADIRRRLASRETSVFLTKSH